ncbi:hypothetical protein PBCVCVM1_320R [Paramecium bursaria Chlorella virus CVM-1]|nr:hypothetical protein PBCVCVM1_320R [Paramecium bursaria Chlorella virus CVM-1]AGE57949.1 hypothetical protein PBCVNW6652_271R [Paramecium bursaria Chlorella virus NW665.2]
MLRQDISIAKIETIISYPFVRLTQDNNTFEDFACRCAKEFGGSPEDWMRKNRKLLGMFGSKNKKLAKNTRFQVPSKLVADASDRFFETVGLARKHKVDVSPTTVLNISNESTPNSSPDQNPYSISHTPDSSPDIGSGV